MFPQPYPASHHVYFSPPTHASTTDPYISANSEKGKGRETVVAQSMPHCGMCARQSQHVALEPTDDNLMACPRCGMVDNAATYARNHVHVSEAHGGMVLEMQRRSFDEQWHEFQTSEEKAFKDAVDRLLNIYLAEPSTSFIGRSAPFHIRRGALAYYLQIRQRELDIHNWKSLANRPGAEKTKYHVAIAVKMALQTSSSIAMENKFEGKKTPSVDTGRPGMIKGDEEVVVPSLAEIFAIANRYPQGHPGRLEKLAYLIAQYRVWSTRLSHTTTPLDSCLCVLLQCVSRMQSLMSLTFSERIKRLRTLPKHSKHLTRDWELTDFTWFETLHPPVPASQTMRKWDEVLDVGLKLYRVQQCVDLWGSRGSPAVGVALALWAMQAVVGEAMPQSINIQAELASNFAVSGAVVTERACEMKNLLICWSTSLPDIGLPFPTFKNPPKGQVGDGFTRWGGDHRRAIPELEIAAVSARSIADNWEKLYKSRLRNRCGVMDLEDEIKVARVMFGMSAPKKAKRQSMIDKLRVPVDSHGNVEKRKKMEEESRREAGWSIHPELLKKLAKVLIRPEERSPTPIASPSMLSSPIPIERNVDTSSVIDIGVSGMDVWNVSPVNVETQHRPVYIGQQWNRPRLPSPPRQPETIDALLQMQEDSSDALSLTSSDDCAPSAMSDSSLGLHLDGKRHTPFAFTVGPTGFNIERNSFPPDADWQTDIEGVGSDVPFSPVDLSRQSSPSTTNAYSASEAERLVSLSAAGPYHHLKTSRSQAPSATSGLTSIPMSPSSTIYSLTEVDSAPANPASDDAHVAQLIREREQYITYKPYQARAAGNIVSEPMERAMKAFVLEEKRKGSIPDSVDAKYLEVMGLEGDPRDVDLGPWLKRMESRMSPQEALLRIGVKPVEFPGYLIIHSMTELRRTLYHWKAANLEVHPLEKDFNDVRPDSEEWAKEWTALLEMGGHEEAELILSPEEAKEREKLWADINPEWWVAGDGTKVKRSRTGAGGSGGKQRISRVNEGFSLEALEELARAVAGEDEGDDMKEDGEGEMVEVGASGEAEDEEGYRMRMVIERCLCRAEAGNDVDEEGGEGDRWDGGAAGWVAETEDHKGGGRKRKTARGTTDGADERGNKQKRAKKGGDGAKSVRSRKTTSADSARTLVDDVAADIVGSIRG